MSDESNPDRTESREGLREMLSRMQDETRRRIKDLRRDQAQIVRRDRFCENERRY